MTIVSTAAVPAQERSITQAALLGAPFAVACVDLALQIAWGNEAFTAFTGLSRDAIVGRPLVSVLPSIGVRAEQLVRGALQRGESCGAVLVQPAGAGGAPKALHWRATISPMRTDSGELCGACCYFHDVTDAATLADQFLQAQKLESIGLLANIIAHDFNNLLSVIQGYCDLLLRDSSDLAKRTKRLGEIRNAAEAAGHLSRQMLTLSRRNKGTLAPVDVNLLVRALGAVLARMLPANVAHELVLAEDLGVTVADPGQVEQMMMNLVTNAAAAMPNGGLLTIETANVTVPPTDASAAPMVAPGDYVTLSVTDSGVGMDEATQARLFDPVFTTRADSSGTGVGLSAVRAMVHQLHGGLSWVSAPGTGSTFSIHLPRVPAHAAGLRDSPLTALGTRDITILLVDDHDQFRQTMADALEEAGCRVLAAAGGAEALRAAAGYAGSIDVVLIDVELRDAAGPALADELVRQRPGMRVLLSSGLGESALSPDDAARWQPAMLSKPFTMHDLVTAIEGVLNPAAPAPPTAG